MSLDWAHNHKEWLRDHIVNLQKQLAKFRKVHIKQERLYQRILEMITDAALRSSWMEQHTLSMELHRKCIDDMERLLEKAQTRLLRLEKLS